MKEAIEQTLGVLVGLPLSAMGRAADMEWIHFGVARQVPDKRTSGTREVGEYALHLQCPWRIVSQQKIVAGRHDLYYPASDQPEVDLLEFDWDRPGVNRCDEQVDKLLKSRVTSPLIVREVQADAVGSVRILMTNGFALEVFPDDSMDGEYSEHWRFFEPATEKPHFVVTGHGIDS